MGVIRSLLAWAIFLLMWWLASCGYQRSSQQHQAIQEAAKAQWQETSAETRTESRNEAKTTSRRGSRRTIIRRPDGTVKKEILEVDDTTATFLASNGVFVEREKQAAAASDAQRTELKDKLSANSVKGGLPWYLWLAGAAMLALIGYACYRRFRSRLPW